MVRDNLHDAVLTAALSTSDLLWPRFMVTGGRGWNDKTGRFMRLSFLTPMDKIVEAFDAIEAYTKSLNYTPEPTAKL